MAAVDFVHCLSILNHINSPNRLLDLSQLQFLLVDSHQENILFFSFLAHETENQYLRLTRFLVHQLKLFFFHQIQKGEVFAHFLHRMIEFSKLILHDVGSKVAAKTPPMNPESPMLLETDFGVQEEVIISDDNSANVGCVC